MTGLQRPECPRAKLRFPSACTGSHRAHAISSDYVDVNPPSSYTSH